MKITGINMECKEIVPKLFQEEGILSPLLKFPGTVLAGGALRDTYLGVEPKDYDIFFTKEGQQFSDDDFNITFKGSADLCCQFLESLDFNLVAETHYTKTYRKDLSPNPFSIPSISNPVEVQIIFRDYYESREDIIGRFDFTNVMFAVDNKGFSIGDDTLKDLDDKWVGINNVTAPLDSLNRLKKYALLGYDVDDAYKRIVKKLKKLSATEVYLGVGTINGNGGSFYGF